jgi:hypothetical protein
VKVLGEDVDRVDTNIYVIHSCSVTLTRGIVLLRDKLNKVMHTVSIVLTRYTRNATLEKDEFENGYLMGQCVRAFRGSKR